jgi:hypothetical protein
VKRRVVTAYTALLSLLTPSCGLGQSCCPAGPTSETSQSDGPSAAYPTTSRSKQNSSSLITARLRHTIRTPASSSSALNPSSTFHSMKRTGASMDFDLLSRRLLPLFFMM